MLVRIGKKFHALVTVFWALTTTGMWGLSQSEPIPDLTKESQIIADRVQKLLSSREPKIFYQVPYLEEGSAELVFQVNADNKPLAAQNLSLKGIMDESPIVYFLLEHPKFASMLRIIHGTGSYSLDVQVILNGKLIESLTYEVLLDRSEQLKRLEALQAWIAFSSSVDWLLTETTTLQLKANLAKATSSCSSCYDDYTECAFIYCEEPIFCEPCELALSECLENCSTPPPPPPNCPTQSSVTNEVYLGSANYGWTCMEDFRWFGNYMYYNQVQNYYQTCITTTHVPCSGQPYTTTTCLPPYSILCHRPTFISCSYGFGFPFVCF